MFGGVDQDKLSNELFILNESNKCWELVQPQSLSDCPIPRSGMRAVSLKNALFLFGGYTNKVNGYLNDTYIYYPKKNAWEKIDISDGFAPSPRVDFSLCKLNERYVLMFGGSDGYSILNDCYLFDTVHKEWREFKHKVLPGSRLGHTCSSFKESAFLFGGWDGKSTLGDVWRFMNNTGWEQLETSNGPIPPRYRHSSSRFGNFMIVFGGVDHHHSRYIGYYI